MGSGGSGMPLRRQIIANESYGPSYRPRKSTLIRPSPSTSRPARVRSSIRRRKSVRRTALRISASVHFITHLVAGIAGVLPVQHGTGGDEAGVGIAHDGELDVCAPDRLRQVWTGPAQRDVPVPDMRLDGQRAAYMTLQPFLFPVIGPQEGVEGRTNGMSVGARRRKEDEPVPIRNDPPNTSDVRGEVPDTPSTLRSGSREGHGSSVIP